MVFINRGHKQVGIYLQHDIMNSGLCVHDFVHLHTCVCASMCVLGGSCVRQDEFRERCSEFHKGEHF